MEAMEEENRFREEFVYSKETLNSQIRDFGFWSLNCYDVIQCLIVL
jgi:hypothetical protein